MHVAAGSKGPAAGSSVSMVAVDDGTQLRALLAVKAAIDGANILRGEWVPSGGFLPGVDAAALCVTLDGPTTSRDSINSIQAPARDPLQSKQHVASSHST